MRYYKWPELENTSVRKSLKLFDFQFVLVLLFIFCFSISFLENVEWTADFG